MDLKESLPSVPFRSLLIHSVCSRDAALFIKYYGQQPFFLDGRTRNSKFAIDLDFQNEVPQSKKDFTLGRKLNLFRILEYARAVIPRGWLMAYAHAYIIGRRSPWIASMPSERSTLTGVRINSGKLAPCGGGCAKILKWMLLTPTLDYAWHWMLADSHT